MDDWAKNYQQLLSSPFGEQIKADLMERRHLLLEDAENARTEIEAYGLLKEAHGVKLALEHLQFKAVTPKDEGGKVKK